MFIELTDHLRCTAEHPESFLVLLPDRMKGRGVEQGSLGCPSCGRVVTIAEGIADFGGMAPAAADTALTPEGIAALLGLSGPGGYVAIFGSAGGAAAQVAAALPGIRLVLVNPPAGTPDTEVASVLRSDRSPIKAKSMRGVVVSADHGRDPKWTEAAVDAVLPGLRAVVEGPSIERPGLEPMAEIPGIWVARVDPRGR